MIQTTHGVFCGLLTPCQCHIALRKHSIVSVFRLLQVMLPPSSTTTMASAADWLHANSVSVLESLYKSGQEPEVSDRPSPLLVPSTSHHSTPWHINLHFQLPTVAVRALQACSQPGSTPLSRGDDSFDATDPSMHVSVLCVVVSDVQGGLIAHIAQGSSAKAGKSHSPPEDLCVSVTCSHVHAQLCSQDSARSGIEPLRSKVSFSLDPPCLASVSQQAVHSSILAEVGVEDLSLSLCRGTLPRGPPPKGDEPSGGDEGMSQTAPSAGQSFSYNDSNTRRRTVFFEDAPSKSQSASSLLQAIATVRQVWLQMPSPPCTLPVGSFLMPPNPVSTALMFISAWQSPVDKLAKCFNNQQNVTQWFQLQMTFQLLKELMLCKKSSPKVRCHSAAHLHHLQLVFLLPLLVYIKYSRIQKDARTHC